MEKDQFKYCGCRITVKEDGTIELDQDEYVDKLKELEIDDKQDSTDLSKHEIKKVRGKVGELLWLSLMTRPDLSFEVNTLSSDVGKGELKLLKI